MDNQREMKRDINLIVDAINMPIMHNLVRINTQTCVKYPAVFEVSGGALIRVNSDVLENSSLETNMQCLVIIANCIKSLIISNKAGKIVASVLKTTASHFADAAMTTLSEG